MKKFFFLLVFAASALFAVEIGFFPEKMIYPMVGFAKWQCGKHAITAEQTRGYSFTSAITAGFDAEKIKFFNVELECASAVNGKLTIYFNHSGRKFSSANFCRKNFSLSADVPQVVSIPMKSAGWKGKIAAFRFDISGKAGLKWTIRRVWFSDSEPGKNAGELVIFPGSVPLDGRVGFKKFVRSSDAITAEHSKGYAYTTDIPLGINAADYKYFNLIVESKNNVSGNMSLYFMKPGEKRYSPQNFLRSKFSITGGKQAVITIPLKGNWKGRIDKCRFDLSATPGQQWLIRKVWFSGNTVTLFNNPDLNGAKSFSGKLELVEKRYDLLEGREYRFALNISGKNCRNAKITAFFYNDVDQLIGKLSSAEVKSGTLELFFSPPESTTRVELVTTVDDKDAQGVISNFQFGATGKRSGAAWQASWICHPQGRRSLNRSSFLFVKEFDLKSLPYDSRLQLTADDGFSVSINGKVIGERPGGWQQTALYDVSEVMRQGKNRIEIKVFNDNGPTGLIAELRCDMPDGKVVTVKTDRTFQVKQLSGSDKLLPFAAAMELGIPPVSPWHCVAYNALHKRETLAVLENSLSFHDKRQIKGTVRFQKIEMPSLSMYLTFPGGVAGKYVFPVKDSAVNIDIDIVKSGLPQGNYALEMDELSVKGKRLLLPFQVPARAKEANIRMQMVQQDGRLQVLMNGKPLWFSGFRARRTSQRDRAYRDGDFRVMFSGASKGASDGSTSGLTWVGPERYDFSVYESGLARFLQNYPESRVIVTCGIDAPVWWAKAHPEECVWFENDTKPQGLSSLASSKWRREGCAALREFIRHMEKSPYASRIIGYRVQAHCSGGEFQYLGTWQRKMADYSPAMQRYFREFLTRRYGSDANLQKAWNNPSVTLATAAIPSGAERRRAEFMVFRDLDKARNVADYLDCHSDAMVTGAMEFLKVVREEAPGKLAGLYGGYVFYYSGFQLLNSAHSNFGKLYRAKLADFISSPHDYIQRKVGWPGGHHGPVVGTSLYNLMWWDENDTRTIMCAPGGHRHVDSLHETIGVLKRDLILQVTKGVGNAFYDLAGGWFDHPGIMEALRKTNLIGKFALTLPGFKRSRVAVLYCAESINRLAISNGAITDVLRNDLRRNLGWSGVTVDQYLLEDILQDNFPEYDCYILPNAYAPGEKVRQAIRNKLMKSGKVIVFGYAPGAFREKQGKIDTDAMKELTGIGFKYEMRKIRRLAVAGAKVFGSGVMFGPAFYIADNSAEVLGYFQGTKLPAFAQKKLANGAVSICTMIPEMTPDMWRDIFRKNNIHVFCDSGDPVYYDGRFVAIHANNSGRKTLRLPAAAEWYDLFRYRKVSGKAKEFSLDMERGQTEIFFIGSEADFRRYVESDTRR